MDFLSITKLIASLSLIFSISLILYQWISLLKKPKVMDYSAPKGSSLKGIIYAFTLGMAPWTKESTRKHWILYLRGILFHIGIFSALFLFILRILLNYTPHLILFPLALFACIGALMGLAGILLRILERNLREISNFDDHLSLWLVSIFLFLVVLSSISSPFTPYMFIFSSLMLLYVPFSKIRHFLYFFFSRIFFGIHIGKRGILRKLEVIHGK